MARLRRLLPRMAAICLVATLSGLPACSSPDPSRALTLHANEQRLVDETVALIRIRLEATRDPEKADLLRKGLKGLYSEAERDALLKHLAENSARGELVLSAIHDSLQSFQNILFPPTTP